MHQQDILAVPEPTSGPGVARAPSVLAAGGPCKEKTHLGSPVAVMLQRALQALNLGLLRRQGGFLQGPVRLGEAACIQECCQHSGVGERWEAADLGHGP